MKAVLLLVLVGVVVFTNAQKHNGVVYAGWGSGVYDNPTSDASLEALVNTKANWVSVVITWYQPTISDTYVAANSNSETDNDIIHITQKAQSLGFKVAFKPHVDLSNDNSHWRGQIGTNFNSAQWKTWFTSYQSYMSHIAGLAQRLGADLYIVGTELVQSDGQEQLWRETISGVRSIFKGPLVYGANWSPFEINWWDAVDFIGVDAYFPLATYQNPPVTTIVDGWSSPVSKIQAVSQKFNKQVLFTEIGYQSNSATAMSPAGASGGELSIEAQANCYEAFFERVYPQSWFAGVFWWAWSTNPRDGGSNDSGFTPHNKTAENLLQKYYG